MLSSRPSSSLRAPYERLAQAWSQRDEAARADEGELAPFVEFLAAESLKTWGATLGA